MNHETSLTVTIPAGALRVEQAPPSHLSQLTVQSAIGIGKRQYLESISAYRAAGGKVLRFGRLRIVERDCYLAWLAEREQRVTEPEQGDDVARLADELGVSS
jgi:hypothetical protein